MECNETKLRNIFVIILFVANLIVLISASFIFYSTLNRLRFSIIEQYKNIYVKNNNNNIKNVVNGIIREIENERGNLIRLSEHRLKESVLKGYRLTSFLYSTLKGKMDESELKDIILNALKREDKNYIVVNIDGIVQLHPSIKKGESIKDFRDSMGDKIFQIIKKDIENNKNKETFISYYLNYPGVYGIVPHTDELFRRLLYVKYFKPYNWFIANILFYKDLDKRLKEKFIRKINLYRYGPGNNGYVFVLKIKRDKKGLKLIRVANPNLPLNKIGTSVSLDSKDVYGKLFVKEMVDKIFTYGEGYVTYSFRVLGSKKIALKTTYIKYYPQWDWIICSGYYPSVFFNELQTKNKKLGIFIKDSVERTIIEVSIMEGVLFFIVIFFVNKIMNRIETYRKMIEERESFQRRLIESMPNPVIVIDKDGNIININDSFRRFFGINQDDVDVSDPQILLIKENAMNYMINQSGNITHLDLIDVKGRLRNIELYKSIFYDAYNNPAGIICILFDITRQKIFEKELIEMSIKDELTGLYNRRYFDQIIAKELVRAKRYKEPLSVIMYDIDYFKKVNDTYGHQAGDEVLKTLSDIVVRNVRSVDFVFRTGGEEFVILLIKTKAEDAFKIAEKIRKIVESYDFPKVGHITISLGVTQLKDDDTPLSFIARADSALYKAKNSGRNNTKIA